MTDNTCDLKFERFSDIKNSGADNQYYADKISELLKDAPLSVSIWVDCTNSVMVRIESASGHAVSAEALALKWVFKAEELAIKREDQEKL